MVESGNSLLREFGESEPRQEKQDVDLWYHTSQQRTWVATAALPSLDEVRSVGLS